MDKIVSRVRTLQRTSVRSKIKGRIKEFEELGKKASPEIFKELCFCILTANFNAKRSIKIQKEIDKGFIDLPESELARKLKELGHRFPNVRASYIVEVRTYSNKIKNIINRFDDDKELREWVVDNVKGLGYKESSHFLRNIGFNDLPITDFHIVELLNDSGIMECKRPINKKQYLGIEEVLRDLAEKLNITLAELDLYLWYMETGEVLK